MTTETENAFTKGLAAYAKKAEAGGEPARKKNTVEANQEWRIITESDAVRQCAIDIIEQEEDICYGPTNFKFDGVKREGIDVPFHMVLAIRARKVGQFVAFHEGVDKDWVVSLKYSTGDVAPYLGQKPRHRC